MKIQKIGRKKAFFTEKPITEKQTGSSLRKNIADFSFKKANNSLTFLLLILVFFVSLFYLYRASIPKTYKFQQGEISNTDIFLTRPIIDENLTEIKAKEASASIKDVFKKDPEILISNEKNVADYINVYSDVRQELYEKIKKAQETSREFASGSWPLNANELKDALWQVNRSDLEAAADEFVKKAALIAEGVVLKSEALNLLSIPPSISTLYKDELDAEAKVLNQQLLDNERLRANLATLSDKQNENNVFFKEIYQQLNLVLARLIRPNAVFDESATKLARENAYKSVYSNPILIEKGTRLISRGEEVSEEKLKLLSKAGLLDEGTFDWWTLAGSLLLLCFVFLVGIKEYHDQTKNAFSLAQRRIWALISTLMLIFISSYYISTISPFFTPIFFLPIILTAYFSLKEALLYSLLMCLASFPLTGFSIHFFFCAVLACVVLSYSTAMEFEKDKYARLIAISAFIPALASVILDVFLKSSFENIIEHALLFAASGIFSAIGAIGSMPLYEMYMDALSPIRLIELSNPSQPILRRLYNEAIGTYHHSLMVAALAEVAAEAIDADAMLVRVGALYHDIGKLYSPKLFTENQEDENPHDNMSPYDSAKIIIGHVEHGLMLAERMHLPKPLLPFISEHHGTTVLLHFFQKAEKEYESLGLMPPDIKDFTYNGPIPQSRESAVLMMADSVEASMKSAGIKNLDEAEVFIRKIIKGKIDQRQLEQSGLTFNEVEKIIEAFLNVYAGQFHERVKYIINENQSTHQK